MKEASYKYQKYETKPLPTAGFRSARAPQQRTLLRKPPTEKQTQKRIPSLAKCLENFILPKKANQIKTVFSPRHQNAQSVN